MTEHDAALRFDQALDGTYTHDLNGVEPLVQTAQTMQSLFDRQHAIPSEKFVMQLEHTLFPSSAPGNADGPLPTVIPSAPSVIPSAVEGSPAAAVRLRITPPRPTSIAPDIHRISHSRLAALAAVLVLFIGGMGAIFGGPLGPRSDPEPSSIPAASFGTVEVSPESVGNGWTVEPPPGISSSDRPLLISNGVALQTFMSGTLSPVQAVDLETGTVLWTELPRVATNVIGATGDLFLIAGGDGTVFPSTYELIALDSRTGDELWSIELTSRPVGLLVSNGRVFVLGSNNLLDAFNLETQQPLWQLDLSELDPSQTDFGGANQSGDLTGDRITMTNGILGVIVSSGRLAAVDAADGTLQWADERATEGWTRVKVVDGKFVVLAFGAEMNMYDPDATPFPTAPHDPAVDPCTLTIQTRDGSTPETAFGIDETVDAFDPETGESPWGLRLPEQYWVWPLDDSRLIAQVESIESAGVADSADLINCLIDGSTGAVSETTGAEFATFAYGDDQTDEPWGMSVLSSGVPFGTGHLAHEVAKELPYFELDPETFTGFRWVQEVDDLIFITAQDGTLIALPKDAPGWSPSKAATPVASDTIVPLEIAWTAEAPQETQGGAGTHAFDDEHLFVSYLTERGTETTVQAVDLETGAAIWNMSSSVMVRSMMVADGLLLVSGRDNSTRGEYPLIALDTLTGEEIWRSNTISADVVALALDRQHVLALRQNNTLQAIDLATGEQIYASDIGGRSTTVTNLVSFDNRLVTIDRIAVAVLIDGSIVGVDIETGMPQWWALRETPGQTAVGNVDGALIVRVGAAVNLEGISENGTPQPIASPVAVASPAIASCADLLRRVAPGATIDSGPLEQREILVMRLDPNTGKTRWSAESDQFYALDLASGDGLLTMIGSGAEWPTDPSQVALCLTDLERGKVKSVDRLSDVAQDAFRFTTTNFQGKTIDVLLVRDNQGGMFLAPAAVDPSVPGPTIELGEPYADSQMIMDHDGGLYLVLNDGSIVKIVLPGD